MDSRITLLRPRNVDWKRAAALLYGDLGTSKAYVIGLAFLAAGFGSLPIILAVCALTGLVSYNYIIVCRLFPDGGGVYSAARSQSRLLAVVGALLLVADLTVTSALSAWSAMSYFGVPGPYISIATIGCILLICIMNFFGPKHSGSLAVTLAVPMVLVVATIVCMSLPHLSISHLHPTETGFGKGWVAFVSVILALSGVETIANLTGVLKLDADSPSDHPKVVRTATKAILPIACEVVLGTALLGWAMLSLPGATEQIEPLLRSRSDDMLRFLAEQYGALTFGPHFGVVFGLAVGLVVGFLLLGAVNTATAALIGLLYVVARDGEMPRSLTRLNSHGVPWQPMVIAAVLPVIVVLLTGNLESLAGLYAIGVVGAISVNLGTCTFNPTLKLAVYERIIMGCTFVLLLAVEVTIARTKPDALFFAVCLLAIGLGVRGYIQRKAGYRTVTVSKEVAAAVAPETEPKFKLNINPGQSIMVAARGLTPVLRFALEEARLRQATLYVLFVREIAVNLPSPVVLSEPPRWQKNPQAAEIMYMMMQEGKKNDVQVIPVYAVSENPVATILDLTATFGIDMLLLGSSHRRTLESILKGNMVAQVARSLPENIQLIIHG